MMIEGQIQKTFGEKQGGIQYTDRIGAYAIIIENDLIATVKTPKGYFLLGGGIETGENDAQCIKRECLEETGYDVDVNEYVCTADTYAYFQEMGYFHPIGRFYKADIKQKIREPIETDHFVEWIKIGEIESKLHLKHQAWAVKQAFK